MNLYESNILMTHANENKCCVFFNEKYGFYGFLNVLLLSTVLYQLKNKVCM